MSFATLTLFAIAGVLFLATFGLQILGYRLGRKRAAGGADEPRDGQGIVEGAVFTLLGLLLAFQFSGAAGRLDTRRELAIREANAIGTAYLRLDLLAADDARALRGLFRQYLDSRVRALKAMPDLAAVAKEIQTAEALQQNIWSRAVAASSTSPEVVRVLLLPALNDMFDIATERKTAGQVHAPFSIQAFLVVLSLTAAVVAGNAMARSPHMPRMHMVVFAAVIAITIYFILDMEYPRVGFIRIGAADQPLYDLLGSIK